MHNKVDKFIKQKTVYYMKNQSNSDLGAVNKRLLFAAYLQGKRDQIYWPSKWEDYEPIGKYRVIKQFLKWYSTVC